jgi:hypothetical protein
MSHAAKVLSGLLIWVACVPAVAQQRQSNFRRQLARTAMLPKQQVNRERRWVGQSNSPEKIPHSKRIPK